MARPKLIDIEGIGEKYNQALREAKVLSIRGLLKAGSDKTGRKQIAEKTGISEALILTWVNHADLFRITGIGSEYAELLERAGVDTVPELAQRDPHNLFEKLIEVNKDKKLVRRLPRQAQVTGWIEQARKLPRMIHY